MPPGQPNNDLPEPPAKGAPVHEHWAYIGKMIKAFVSCLPRGTEPETLSFPYPGEGWKERGERSAAEDEAGRETREALTEFLRSGMWPTASGGVAFFAHERLDFAAKMVAALATRPEPREGNEDPVPRPRGTIGDVICWFAIDVYDAGHFPRHRWRNDSTDREY
jgi:hypothetical protein